MKLLDELDTALEEVVKNCIGSDDYFSLLFSGGLDSSLLAKICVDLGLNPILVSVYMEGSVDESVALKAAEFFDLEIVERVLFKDEIKDLVDFVSDIISSENPLDITIGVPIYAALETAAWSGFKCVMVGQGADELFAGYYRYLSMDKKKLDAELRKDVENINIGRDTAIAKALDITLLTPFLDEKVVDLGLGIPVDLKINNMIRKFILRELAKKRGLPREIWAREKKAIQYSTGVDKIVKKVLKTKGFDSEFW